jgi:tetratricopeptide (TPR) repeat protein
MADSKSAAEELSAMIEASPKDKKLRLIRAESLVKAQDFEEALSDYSFAGSLVEKDMDARAKRAECYFALGQYDTAAREFALVNRAKADYNSLYLEAMSLKALTKYSEAVLCFTRAIAMKPLMVRSFAQRADCYFRMKDYAHSESDFDDAIALDPKNYSLYFARGLCRLAAGNAVGAVKDLTVCLADHNLHSVAYAARAKAYTKLGKHDLAAQDLRASGSASKAVEGDLFKQ